MVEEYKSFENFLNDVDERSVRTFHEGFRDCQNKVKKLFPSINTTLLIPSIVDPIVEEVMEAWEDITTPIEVPSLTTPNATPTTKVPSNIEALIHYNKMNY